MRRFSCSCGARVYFENTCCVSCGRALGFLSDCLEVRSLAPGGDGLFHLDGEEGGRAYRQCLNYRQQWVCNWMVPEAEQSGYCLSCRLNEVIPNLDAHQKNRLYWARIETAKRYLIYSLLALGLPVRPKSEDAEKGLAFSFLADKDPDTEFTAPLAGQEPAPTGHDAGHITINLAEADEVARTRMQESLGERYRTLLGHFRHEIGHYYWETLIVPHSGHLEEYRALFGDERQDYDECLRRHYQEGPIADWSSSYISAYAGAHPWEDWAETWAHYLHMMDGLETACDFSLAVGGAPVVTANPAMPQDAKLSLRWRELHFPSLLDDWARLGIALNALSRSLGQADSYPFVLHDVVRQKIAFVHRLILKTTEKKPEA